MEVAGAVPQDTFKEVAGMVGAVLAGTFMEAAGAVGAVLAGTFMEAAGGGVLDGAPFGVWGRGI
jgi:hypothetical protein